ncbi:CoA transferase [Spirillospora sp. NPDC029432]|uniref:CoA transferase n=1 Tax=Spirillospora sp. NPDC029432 TaxID=3154599 RepID=UPI003453EBE6
MEPGAAWARSGIVPLTGRPGGPPRMPPGRAAALAAELADRFAAVTGVAIDGPALLSERAAFTDHRRRGRISAGGSCRLLPTADGWAAVSCARPDDPSLLGALIGAETGADPWPAVTAWLARHTGAELAERAEPLGIAAGPIARPAAWSPDLATAARPVRDLLVVDFSALWAGPLCAHLLGLAGARVIKVETPDRPDGARRGDPAFYDLLHAGHRSVVLDPGTADGRAALRALVDAADIVIEASRPHALARWGLDAREAVAAGTAWISITAHGRSSQRVGFGDDIAASCGLVARDGDGSPLFAGDAIADPLTGLAAAVLALRPEPRLHDLAMGPLIAATLPDHSPAPSPAPSPAAFQDGDGWMIETEQGALPVAVPRRRSPAGRAPRSGEHTAAVLKEL